MAMTYADYLRANRLTSSAQSAVAWLKSGQAPPGTVIPESMRQYFGGQARIGPSTPGVDQPRAPGSAIPENVSPYSQGITNIPRYVEPAGPTKPVIPTDVGRQLAIDQILNRMRALPSLYNPQRSGLAANTAADLVGQGYFDNATTEETTAPIDAGISADQRPTAPDVTYRIVQGQDGRLYRQAYAQLGSAAASHGAYFGSQNEANIADAQRQLNASRDAVIRNYGEQSSALTRAEGAEYQGLQSDLTGARSSYADWKAAQPVPVPAEPVRPAAPVVPQGMAPLRSISVPPAATAVQSGVQKVTSTILPQLQRLATMSYPKPVVQPTRIRRWGGGFI